jgi:hypothetical protein
MKDDVATYLEALPAGRREMIAELRQLILKHLPAGYAEELRWGMLSYEVPLATYPKTYNKQPLSYIALGNQKGHMSLYLNGPYGVPVLRERLEQGFAAAGKKLDAGKSCVRFKKLEDLALLVVAELVAALSVADFIRVYEQSRDETSARGKC